MTFRSCSWRAPSDWEKPRTRRPQKALSTSAPGTRTCAHHHRPRFVASARRISRQQKAKWLQTRSSVTEVCAGDPACDMAPPRRSRLGLAPRHSCRRWEPAAPSPSRVPSPSKPATRRAPASWSTSRRPASSRSRRREQACASRCRASFPPGARALPTCRRRRCSSPSRPARGPRFASRSRVKPSTRWERWRRLRCPAPGRSLERPRPGSRFPIPRPTGACIRRGAWRSGRWKPRATSMWWGSRCGRRRWIRYSAWCASPARSGSR